MVGVQSLLSATTVIVGNEGSLRSEDRHRDVRVMEGGVAGGGKLGSHPLPH